MKIQNSPKYRVEVDGVEYSSMEEAARLSRYSMATLYRIRSGRRKNDGVLFIENVDPWDEIVSKAEELVLKGMNLQQVSESLGVDYGQLYGQFKRRSSVPEKVAVKYGEKHREGARRRRKLSDELLPVLTRLYHEEKLSMKEIGAMYGAGTVTVMNFFERHGIKRRSHSETASMLMVRPEMKEHFRKLAFEGRIGVYRNGLKCYDTKPELIFKDWCVSRNVEFRQQYVIKGKRHPYDFYLTEHNLLVEIDGVYWHSRPGRQEDDERHTNDAIFAGYRIVRITDKDCNHDNFDRLVGSLIGRARETQEEDQD